MKKKTIFATALCCAFLTACTSIAPGEQANLDESVDDLAVIEESTAANAATEASTEETPEEYNFTFNPHVYPKKLYDAYSPDEWETFTNLCNALEAGEDTFKAASRETYEWCFSGGPLDEYFPVARFALGVDFLDGYTDGVGKIIYDIPKEEFKQKQEEFEKLVIWSRIIHMTGMNIVIINPEKSTICLREHTEHTGHSWIKKVFVTILARCITFCCFSAELKL